MSSFFCCCGSLFGCSHRSSTVLWRLFLLPPHPPVLLLLPATIWFSLTVRPDCEGVKEATFITHTHLISSVCLRSRLQNEPSNRSESISRKWLNMEASHLYCYCCMNVFQLWQPCRTFGSHLHSIIITTEHEMINNNNSACRQRPNLWFKRILIRGGVRKSRWILGRFLLFCIDLSSNVIFGRTMRRYEMIYMFSPLHEITTYRAPNFVLPHFCCYQHAGNTWCASICPLGKQKGLCKIFMD